MRYLILLAIVLTIFIVAQTISGQDAKTSDTKNYQANAADVVSIDSIVKAVYQLISGGAEEKRDWDRFRALFYKDARMIPTGKNKNTVVYGAWTLTIEEYIKRASPIMSKDGFFEREISRRTETYGNIAHVFSTYESFLKTDDKKPFERGINSFQLVNDGKRWWILSIMWQGETPDVPLPEKYLNNNNVRMRKENIKSSCVSFVF